MLKRERTAIKAGINIKRSKQTRNKKSKSDNLENQGIAREAQLNSVSTLAAQGACEDFARNATIIIVTSEEAPFSVKEEFLSLNNITKFTN